MLYFFAFVALLIVSGIMIYAYKTSLSIEGVQAYYLGSSFTLPKTNAGLLKTLLPHIFAFALLSMVLLHFLAFTKFKKKMRSLIYIVFLAQTFELFTPFLMIDISAAFVFIKLTALFVYITALFLISALLVTSIIRY